MITYYKFRNYQVSPETKILIIGTFNPDIQKNKIDFFYSRPRNYLWRIIPEVLGEVSLKNESTEQKKAFIKKHQIDFTDLIGNVTHQLNMPNYSDQYLENQELEWNKTEMLLSSLTNLQLVLFTRKTFNGIPKIKNRFLSIHRECEKLKITSRFVITPARTYNVDKLNEWKNALYLG